MRFFGPYFASAGDGQPVYLRDSLLIDVIADEKTTRARVSIRTDHIGMVFVVVRRDVRRCFICEQIKSRLKTPERAFKRRQVERSYTIRHPYSSRNL
jgi:hypothetical protein